MATISGVQGYWQVDLIVTETSRSSVTNTSTASWELWIRRTYASDYPMYGTPTINISISGKTAYSGSQYFALSSVTQNGVKLLSGTVTGIEHYNDGNIISNNASFTWTGSGFSPNNVSGSGTYETTKIPRYASVSQSLFDRSTKTITVKWTSDSTCDYVWYSKDGGSWVAVGSVNATSGTYVIPSLSENTTYSIKTRVRRKDSQLTTDSSASSWRTYTYAKLSTAPNFNDENNPTITYTNELGNGATSVQACIAKADGAGIGVAYRDIPKTGTSYTFNLTETERTSLRNAVLNGSNTLTVRFYIRTTVDNTDYYSFLERTLTIVNANPTFSNFEFSSDDRTYALTGSRNSAIANYTNVTITISDSNKASPKKGASIVRYNSSAGTSSGVSSNVNYPVSYMLNKVNSSIITTVATDNRGLSNTNTVQKTIANYVNYSPMTYQPMTATRTGNVGTQTTIAMTGTIDLVDFGDVTNEIENAKYYYKEASSSGGFTEGASTLNVNLTQKSGTIYNYSINQAVQGDLGGEGFDHKAYIIKIVLSDELSSVESSVTLASGEPAIDVYKNRVALGMPYNESNPAKVQLNEMTITKFTSMGNLDNFKSYCVSEAPIGITIYHLSFNGSMSCAILEKANSNYLSFIHFSYGINAKQYRYFDGTWYDYQL